MEWELHKKVLAEGKNASFRPKGNSMSGKISSGQLVTVSPDIKDVKKGDIVFCKVKGNHYVHLVQAVKQKMGDTLYQIGNVRGHTNGTVGVNCVFGKVIRVED